MQEPLYDKQDYFNFEIVNFQFLDGDVPLSPSYGVYVSQIIGFAKVCSNVSDKNSSATGHIRASFYGDLVYDSKNLLENLI